MASPKYPLRQFLKEFFQNNKVKIYCSNKPHTCVILSSELSKRQPYPFFNFPKPKPSPLSQLQPITPSTDSDPKSNTTYPLWSPNHHYWEKTLKIIGVSDIVRAVIKVTKVGVTEGKDEMKKVTKSSVGLGPSDSEPFNDLAKLIHQYQLENRKRFDDQGSKLEKVIDRLDSSGARAAKKSSGGWFPWSWGKNREGDNGDGEKGSSSDGDGDGDAGGDE